jgi:hypothetical protein
MDAYQMFLFLFMGFSNVPDEFLYANSINIELNFKQTFYGNFILIFKCILACVY